MSVFSTKKDLVSVELAYLEVSGGEIFVIRDEEDKEKYKDKIKIAKAKFERQNWKNFNTYIKGCVVTDSETGVAMIDTIALRDHKLRNLLKSLEDGDGARIKLNADFFDNLIPDFATALVDEYDNFLDIERLSTLRESDYYKDKLAEAEKKAEKEEDGDLDKEKEEKEEKEEKDNTDS